jgi:ABC-type bacteriocin/lantibiotic exporter with double-glycine peptidase domain
MESLKRYNIKSARFAVLYILLAAAAAVSGVISIQATGNMTQAAELGITGEMISFLIVLAVAGLVQTVTGGISALLEKRAYGRVIHKIRSVFAEKLLRMRYKEFSSKNSGEGASLFTVDVPQAASFLTLQMLSQAAQITALIVSVVYMLFISWWLTLAYLALFPVLALMQAKIAAPIGQKREEVSKRRAEYNAVVSDALQNPLTVLAYGLEGSVEKRYTDSYAKYYKAAYSSAKTTAGLALVGIFAAFLPTLALFFIACAVVINGGMTIAEFIALSIIAGPVINWLTMLSQELARLQTAKASIIRINGFLPDAEEETGGGAAVEPSQGCAVSFNNVFFGYSDDAAVFEDLSFSVEKGCITAIAGPSGCGKSTALKLMLELYSPDDGSIVLSSDSLTYVPQDCYLLPVSICENILCGSPMDTERLNNACENAGILSFIQTLPDGFDTVLTESAANVSGGQKQRIAMARAFYRDADILLLDEATSALDPATEQAILESFKSYIKSYGKTAVVVAHRQAVLDMSDRILYLGNGVAV